MGNKCPRCGSTHYTTTMLSKQNGLERGLMAAAALGITAVGAMIGGTIGAVAGGTVGKMVSNVFSNQATHPEAVYGWKCNRCGHEWTE